ncbi:MAG: YfhO family protein [Cyclobacteriaceae bacterium]|nr:YfhO family protein [Cyclobacteriaceae bacterium]
MKKISFSRHVLPHLVAVAVFLLVTVILFHPVFFENKTVNQHDILQSKGASKALLDFREQTGEEGLWSPSMFSGMPAYLISVQWGYEAISWTKRILSLNLPSPVHNIYLSFLCYYILLLAFRIRPYLAIAGAVGFGLSSYLIIGMAAGHNARIGAIAFMPMVMAGIHLSFRRVRWLGFGLTTLGLALHLRENHLQITYYLVFIVLAYGLVQLVEAIQNRKVMSFIKTVGVLIPAVLLAAGSFFGPLWAINEYSRYSIRGKSELIKPNRTVTPEDGLSKAYAFEYSNGIIEPLTLLVPNVLGGSSMQNLFEDDKSKIRQALQEQGIPYNPQQMYQPSYWGSQPLSAPYYAGAIMVFLFLAGLWIADRRYVWWLAPVSLLAVLMSWGSNFSSFNYFLFDYLPGYNKFRSVTFALIIPIFSMPLLGLLAIERILNEGLRDDLKRKLLIAFGTAAGICLLLIVGAGLFSYLREGESNMPAWFVQALRDDRRSLLRSDALRALIFISLAFALLYFETIRTKSWLFFGGLTFLITVDMIAVNKRYFTKANYISKRKQPVEMSAGDRQVLADTTYYRVLNLNGTMNDALTSYYHNSLGGYHGAKLKRYQDLYDSCITRDIEKLINSAQTGEPDFKSLHTLNMLNTRYIFYGNNRSNILFNPEANGPAWFVREIKAVNTPNEELAATCENDAKYTAVIDQSKFALSNIAYDSNATIRLTARRPNRMAYRTSTAVSSLALFSEIYYPHGWEASIDGQPATIIRSNYVLRALFIPAGEHRVEFIFRPRAWTVGNTVTRISAWLVVLVFAFCAFWEYRLWKKDAA